MAKSKTPSQFERRLLRAAEAADRLGISPAYFYKLRAAGKIPVRRIGDTTRHHVDDIDAYAANLPLVAPTIASEPTVPLLPVDQQRLAVERAEDAPKRRPRKAKSKAKTRPRPHVAQGAPEPPAPVEQQPPADEPPAPLDQQPDLAAVYAERLGLLAPNAEEEEEPAAEQPLSKTEGWELE